MKNVNGLANAMRLVEGACEKGEITIIGEGATPTPVELYKKCVAYINKQYGVDILNLVLKEQKPCECNGSCITVIAEADDKEIVVNIWEAEEIIGMIINDNMGYLNENLVKDIVEEIKSYYEDIDGNIPEDYSIDYAVEKVYEAFANHLDLADFDEYCIADIVSKIVEEVDEKCISIE